MPPPPWKKKTTQVVHPEKKWGELAQETGPGAVIGGGRGWREKQWRYKSGVVGRGGEAAISSREGEVGREEEDRFFFFLFPGGGEPPPPASN